MNPYTIKTRRWYYDAKDRYVGMRVVYGDGAQLGAAPPSAAYSFDHEGFPGHDMETGEECIFRPEPGRDFRGGDPGYEEIAISRKTPEDHADHPRELAGGATEHWAIYIDTPRMLTRCDPDDMIGALRSNWHMAASREEAEAEVAALLAAGWELSPWCGHCRF